MSAGWAPWIAFNLFLLCMLAFDLGVLHRRPRAVSLREAAAWSGVWVGLGLAFGAVVLLTLGKQAGLEYYTGYLIEKSLSVDNVFVFVLVFSTFRVPREHQHRVLFWGILGALIMRGVLIGAGAYLIHRFHWILYVFGAILLVTGLRMLFERGTGGHAEPRVLALIRALQYRLPLTADYHGGRFLVRERERGGRSGRLVFTPLFLVLIAVEASDLIFAVDSIPAIFGVTRDPFIVYTSNVFAVLGLRSLYFVLAGVIDKFHYLKLGLSIVLVWIGAKMLLLDVFHMPIVVSLGVVATVLAASIGASLLFPKRAGEHSQHVSETAEKTRASRKPEEDEVIPPIS